MPACVCLLWGHMYIACSIVIALTSVQMESYMVCA